MVAKLALALVAVLALALGVYWFTRSPAATPIVELPAVPKITATTAVPVVDAPTIPDRSAIAAPAAPLPEPSAADETRPLARCVDVERRPLSDAWMKRPRSDKLVARANENGELRIEPADLGRDGPANFLVGCKGFVTRKLDLDVAAGTTPPLGELVLERGGFVSGTVVDEQHAPVADAEIVITVPKQDPASANLEMMRVIGPPRDASRITSGNDGRFRFEDVQPGTVRVWAHAKDFRWSLSAPIAVEVGQETRDVELVLEREGSAAAGLGAIEGIVLAPDGTQVKLPKISLGFEAGSWIKNVYFTGLADGHFEVIPPGHGVLDFQFEDVEQRWTPARLSNVAPGTRNLVVRLGDAKQVTLIVRSHGQPVTRFDALLEDNQSQVIVPSREPPNDERAEGRVVTRVPPGSFRVKVDASGFQASDSGPFDGGNPPPEITVELAPLGGVRGHVIAAGKPVSGARVWAQPFARHAKVFVNDFELWVQDSEVGVTTSDEQGAFSIAIEGDDEYVLFAEAAGWAKGELGPFAIVAAQSKEGLEIALDVGGAIEGQVLMPTGQAPTGTIVGVNHGDGKFRTQSVGPDGHFRFDKLTPGGWKLMRCHAEFSSGRSGSSSSGAGIEGGRIDTNCVVESARTTMRDLDLRNGSACVLELELQWNGTPARSWHTDLVPAIPRPELPFRSGATDAQGRLRIDVEEPGQYKLDLDPPAELASPTPIQLPLELRAGTNVLTRNLKTGRLEGTIAAWQPDPNQVWRYESGEGADFQTTIYFSPDASGRFALAFVPAGPGAITRSVGLQLTTAARFTLEAGKTLAITVP